jgi:hypothetical protein
MNRQVCTAGSRHVATVGGANGGRLATLALASSVVVAFLAAASAPTR